MANKPALKMTLKEDLATREDVEDEGQPRCNRWTCWSAPLSAKAKKMQLQRRRQMQAQVNVVGQASTNGNDAFSSVFLFLGNKLCQIKRGDAECLWFVIWVCYKFCHLDAPASEANCVAMLGNLLVLSTLVGYLRRGEVNMSENELKEWRTTLSSRGNCDRWLNCAQVLLGEQNCRNLSVPARAVTRCPFQPTNRAVWKMGGAERERILVVVSRRVRWLRLAFCNGDFAIAIMRMHTDHDGDTRMIGWCDSHAGWCIDRHHWSNGRGLVCPRWQKNPFQHHQCSAVHSGARLLRPMQSRIYIPASKRPRSSAAAKWGRGSVLTRSKRIFECRRTVVSGEPASERDWRQQRR